MRIGLAHHVGHFGLPAVHAHRFAIAADKTQLFRTHDEELAHLLPQGELGAHFLRRENVVDGNGKGLGFRKRLA